jgi:hypothetical protein
MHFVKNHIRSGNDIFPKIPLNLSHSEFYRKSKILYFDEIAVKLGAE